MSVPRLAARRDFFDEVDVFRPQGLGPERLWGSRLTERGLYVQTNRPYAVGERVRLRFEVHGHPVEVRQAEVVRVRPFEPISVDGELPGMELRFLAVDPPSRGALRTFAGDEGPRLSLVPHPADGEPALRPLSLPPAGHALAAAVDNEELHPLARWTFEKSDEGPDELGDLEDELAALERSGPDIGDLLPSPRRGQGSDPGSSGGWSLGEGALSDDDEPRPEEPRDRLTDGGVWTLPGARGEPVLQPHAGRVVTGEPRSTAFPPARRDDTWSSEPGRAFVEEQGSFEEEAGPARGRAGTRVLAEPPDDSDLDDEAPGEDAAHHDDAEASLPEAEADEPAWARSLDEGGAGPSGVGPAERAFYSGPLAVWDGPAVDEQTPRRVRGPRRLGRGPAVALVVVGACAGVGLGLVTGGRSDGPAPRPAAVAAPTPSGAAPRDVADVEAALRAPAPAPLAAPAGTEGVAEAPPAKPVVAAVPASEPPRASAPPAAPRREAVSSSTTAADAAASVPDELLVEEGRITVPLVGGTVVKTFGLSGPSRVVVDLEGARYPGFVQTDIGDKGIARYRVGRPDAKRVRVVVELEREAAPRDITVQQLEGRLRMAWR